jgi:hypothetical protein
MGPLERTRMIPTSATTLIRVAYPFQPQPAFVAFRPAPQPCSQVSQPAVRDSSTKGLGRRRCCRPRRAGRRDRAAANSRFYHGHADGDPKAAPSLRNPSDHAAICRQSAKRLQLGRLSGSESAAAYPPRDLPNYRPPEWLPAEGLSAQDWPRLGRCSYSWLNHRYSPRFL